MPSFERWPRAALILLVTLSWLGLGGVASAQDPAGETIRAIEFEGLRRLGPEELKARIVSRVGDPYDASKLTEDIRRLYALGVFESEDGKSPPVQVRTEARPGGGVVIVFTVNERPIVVDVQVTGAKAFKSGEIQDALRTQVGRPYDTYRAKRDAERLEAALVAKGYGYVEVTPKVSEAGPGRVALSYEVRAGPQITVDRVIFVGVTLLEDPEDLLEQAALKTKERTFWGLGEEGYFVRDKLEEDLRQLERFYRSKGYLDAQATIDELRFSADRSQVSPVIRIVEGTRYTVRKVDIRGNLVFSRSEIRERLELRAGKPFLGNDLLEDVEAIQRLYAEQAYIHAKARFEVLYDRDRQLLDILYTITEGPKVRVERIVIEGNEKTKDKVIRRELSVKPGELFDARKLEQSLGRLGRRRYFEDINVDFRPGRIEGSESLVLKVKEARTGSITFGAGISTNAGFFGNIVLSQRNFDITDVPTSFDDVISGRAFTGGGQILTIQAQPGRERSQYRVSFTEPFLFDTPLLFGLQAFIFDRIRPDYREGRVGFIPRLGYRITPDLTVAYSHRLERVRIFDLEFDATPDAVRASGNNYISGGKLELILDRNLVDTQFVQYSGYGASASYEVLGGPFGGEVTLSRAEVAANWQTTVWEFPDQNKWVFGVRGTAGWQEPYGRDSETPIFERYFAGGVRSFRGFEFRSVSPRDGLRRDEPIGGDFQVLGTVDFSFPLFKGFLRGVIFMDAGTVESNIEDFRFNRVRYTAGFGFRVNVAIFPAPVALDFAFPIRARRIDDEQVFSFAVGIGF